jgi:hypothetical protein
MANKSKSQALAEKLHPDYARNVKLRKTHLNEDQLREHWGSGKHLKHGGEKYLVEKNSGGSYSLRHKQSEKSRTLEKHEANPYFYK